MIKTEGAEYKFLTGGGEMAKQIRAFPWSHSPLGPLEHWPQSLKTSVSLMLNSQHPMWIGWGPEATFLYNDAYIQVLSLAKHPWALGRSAQEVWSEIWNICGPLADKVFQHGEASFVNDVRLFMNRGDFLEETFYSFSYSPIRDESGNVGGLFCPSAEVTAKVLNTRRLRTLSELAAKSLVEKSTQGACASAIKILSDNPDDLPFALLYLVDADGRHARLEQAAGLAGGQLQVSSQTVDLTETGAEASFWPMAGVLRSAKAAVVPLQNIEGFPTGAAGQRITEAMVLPVISRGEDRPLGVLIAGVNPTRKLDADYHTFYQLTAGHVATAIQNARAVEEERKRAEALSELDRTKTAFFNNVSHELRTPLTLILGPLEDEIRESKIPRERLEVVHRNSLRLLKLVNTLLDFSRIEAGRAQAIYVETDLALLTTNLASVFRSAMEKAGLKFTVDCPPLPQSVLVDSDMWEKIIFNLLSNALKFTLFGSIEVSLRTEAQQAVLSVRDTGLGIPAEELPKLFQRFHRIENLRGRSYEGTGIGLALAAELVKLHAGTIEVESREGQGTVFHVRIPFGEKSLLAHAPKTLTPPKLSALRGAGFIEETSTWLSPHYTSMTGEKSPTDPAKPRILLADDNGDMRDYIRQLLGHDYEIDAVTNGAEALAAAEKNPPQLILSDVMMPVMNGFELVQQLRIDKKLRVIPIILLSARAGEEARVEGVSQGADDYLTKPFNARELMARVATHLKLARLRKEAQDALQEANALLGDKTAHLETLVQQRTVKLRETIGELEAFSYSVAHDLRAPLRSLQGFSDVLLTEHADQLDADGRGFLQRIARAAARMDKLIQDVLNYSRVVRADLPLENVDIGHLLRGIADTYPMLANDRVDIELAGSFPVVSGNEAMLTQIFSNLLGNAVKFVAPGVWPRLKLWSEPAGKQIRIFVQDNGIGIAPEQHEKIFGIFEQLNKNYDGTGIGLAIVKKATARIGGKVGLKSTPGEGSTFWIDVDLAQN